MKHIIIKTLLVLLLQTSVTLAAQTLLEVPNKPDGAGNNPTAGNQASGAPVAQNLDVPKLEGPAAKAYEAYSAGRFDEAIKLAKPLVDIENADALYLMGIAHESGKGMVASREKALEFYQRAAKKSHKDAPLRTSLILLSSDKYQEREDARKLLEETAKIDAKVAGRILGEAWLRGLLSDNPDANQAVSWWQRAASAGDLPSIRVLAAFYEGQMGFPENKDQAKALKLYGEAADLGDVESMVILGSRLLNSDAALKNESSGLEWLNKAAKAGGVAAYFVIGDYQENAKKSDKLAFAAYKRGAEAGQPDCMVRMANFYLEGRGMEKNIAKAKELLKDAAQKGSTQAQFQFAMILASEEKPDLNSLYLNLLSAANGNIIPAQNELGMLYLSGKMGLADQNAAVAWLTRAAKSGHAPAQNSLGALYESGSAGLQQNLQNAGELYKLAANQGHPDAMLAIIRLTLVASGDKQNLTSAWAQVSLIAEQGHENAIKMATQIASQLDAKQLSEAKKLLKEYKEAQATPAKK